MKTKTARTNSISRSMVKEMWKTSPHTVKISYESANNRPTYRAIHVNLPAYGPSLVVDKNPVRRGGGPVKSGKKPMNSIFVIPDSERPPFTLALGNMGRLLHQKPNLKRIADGVYVHSASSGDGNNNQIVDESHLKLFRLLAPEYFKTEGLKLPTPRTESKGVIKSKWERAGVGRAGLPETHSQFGESTIAARIGPPHK